MNRIISSPFHAGEQAIQERLGVRDRMEHFGRQVVRNHLSEQHRAFFRQLPFVVVGHADHRGWPWASMLFNAPGFMTSADPAHLCVAAKPLLGDPLADAIEPGERLGLLGIEFHSRRRNRLSGHVSAVADIGFELTVDQAFGNCPQYIQTRAFKFASSGDRSNSDYESLQAMTTRARKMIQLADTFFVASYVADGTGAASEGVDVSHRGGRPGFIRIDDAHTLTIPDYPGNNHFNTLGNFHLNPRAGLLFVDFESGDMLMLTGQAEILWDDTETPLFEGAERLWRFRMDQGRFLPGAMPLRWSFGNYSPNTLMTGTWDAADALSEAESTRQQWREFRVVRIEDESKFIRSFYLEPVDGVLSMFKAGQFLTLRLKMGGDLLIRTYTLSSGPADTLYRISVKRELATGKNAQVGKVSGFLHDQVKVGDCLEAKAPLGNFTLDAGVARPAVLLSAGVGITPMMSMLRHTLHEGMRTRYLRELIFVHAASHVEERPFYSEIRQFVGQSGGVISYYSVLGQIDEKAAPEVDFQHVGRMTTKFMQSIMPADDSDYYLCGPPAFMQNMYDLLRDLNVVDQRIHAKEFGPASLRRENGVDQALTRHPATEGIVEFAYSRFEQAWTSQAGSLLELAESHDLAPAYGCRSGQCGACKTRLLSGEVAYQYVHDVELEDDEVLLCCCVPAKAPDGQVARVSVAI